MTTALAACVRKAGLSGLLLASVFALPVLAEPLVLEVAEASAAHDKRDGKPIVKIRFVDGAKRALAQFSESHIGRKFTMRVKGEVVISSVFREPILGGVMQISGSFSTEQAHDITGHLPADTKAGFEAAKD
jgi:hypothetical protein